MTKIKRIVFIYLFYQLIMLVRKPSSLKSIKCIISRKLSVTYDFKQIKQ